jgi:hypothetical protein
MAGVAAEAPSGVAAPALGTTARARLLNTSVGDYHADDLGIGTPTLNATVAKSLVLETPAHAKQKHPRLMDGQYVSKHTDAMDEGTALHQMLLGDDRCDIFDYDAWTTKDARADRDASRAAGRVPFKRKQWDEIALLGDALKAQVAAFPIDPPLFVDGMAEQTILWYETWEGREIACRARLDWLRSDYRCIDDLKKSRSADPRKWQRAMWPLGYDIQAAFYVRACRAAFGVEPVFRWVAIEPEPPYAMSVHVLSADAMSAAQAKVDLALDIWSRCLESGDWPAYPLVPNVVELPSWMQTEEWDDTALEAVPF